MSNEKKLRDCGFAAPEAVARETLLSMCLETREGLAMPYQTKEQALTAIARRAEARSEAIAATGVFAPGFPALDHARLMKAAQEEWDRLDIGVMQMGEAARGMMTYAKDGELVMTPQGLGTISGAKAVEDARGNEGMALVKLSEYAQNFLNAEREKGAVPHDRHLETFMSAGRLEIEKHYRGTGQEEGLA